MSVLQFEVFSGGTVSFDLETCARCETKACVKACSAPNLNCAITLQDGVPALRMTPEAAAKGGCVECLACELACATDGLGGITWTLPMPELDEYLRESRAQGVVPGFERS
jgi:NAD-dependent dihydropyrimidine dehydrogenase PreA subunit